MLVQRSREMLSGEGARLQYANLQAFDDCYDGDIVVMLSNGASRQELGIIDFLHNPQEATDHVLAGISFATGLPIGRRKLVTFHMNALVSIEEMAALSREEWWFIYRRDIAPLFAQLAVVAKAANVELLLETVPVPEFGDSCWRTESYRGILYPDLRNPFYLTCLDFQKIRGTGMGICLDLCHSWQVYQQAHETGNGEQVLHRGDQLLLRDYSLFTDVVAVRTSELIHLNQARGRFSLKGGRFDEGIILSEGEIPKLEGMFGYLATVGIPMVIEIADTDFEVRAETQRSIEWILRHLPCC